MPCYMSLSHGPGSHEPGLWKGSSGLHPPGGPAFVPMHAGMVRLGGAGVKGWRARAKKLSTERRREAARKAAQARWKKKAKSK